jgi:thermosome
MKEGTERSTGIEVIKNNIAAAKILSEMLKSSLGPKGMDKMIIESGTDVTVTNDGATIVKQMEVQHPAARLLVEAAKAQDSEVGDGTTSAVVLAGFLLEKSDSLIDLKIHPNIIIEGYKLALSKALEVIRQKGKKVDPEDKENLRNIVRTTLASKFFSSSKSLEKVIDLVIDAVLAIAEKRDDGTYNVDLKNIKIVKAKGGEFEDSYVFNGIVLDKSLAHESMPKSLKDVKIAILDFGLEVEKPEISTKIGISSPDQIKLFLEEQTKYIKSLIDKLAELGVKLVVTEKGMDDIAQYLLAKKGIMGIKRVKRSDIELLAKTTGAKIISSIKDVSESDLGFARYVESRKLGKDDYVFIETEGKRAVTLMLRGSNEMIMDEAERSMNDAFNAVRNILLDPIIVAGGGGIEEEIAKELREYSGKVSGKEQLAIMAYADALEEIPATLATTAGMDPIQAIVELRNKHSNGLKNAGIDVLNGKIADDMIELKIVDPVRVKEQVLKSSTEAAVALLRIDDLIAAKPVKKKESGEQQAPPMGMM